MELIAAAKMRRAQQRVLASRPYATKLIDFVGDLVARQSAAGAGELHPLMEVREPGNIGVILVTPDRGLCGGLNANLIRTATRFSTEQTTPVSWTAVGRKGRDFLVRYGRDVRAEFTAFGDFPSPIDTAPIAAVAVEGYTERKVDRVYLVFADYVSVSTQRPTIRQLLPIQPPEESDRDATALPSDFEYEPDPDTVLGTLLPRYVEMLIYQAVLENAASEQTARMVAMRNATDSAEEMISDLSLIYNKARQESITTELLDLVGGVAALEAAS
jgi:F-type H+-transporting ATPase subunit gamma